jgi:hypothetical protein
VNERRRIKEDQTVEVYCLPRHNSPRRKPYRRQRGSSVAYLGSGRAWRGGRSNEETMARQRVAAAGAEVK